MIIITFSGMPCGDAFAVSEKSHATTQIVDDSSHEKSHHSDSCSPFCVCNCCHVASCLIYGPFTHEYIQITPITKNLPQEYSTVFISNFYGCIWQPPQLA